MPADNYEEILKTLLVRIRKNATSRVGPALADDVAQETIMVLHRKYSHVRDEVELTKLASRIAHFKIKEIVRGNPPSTGLETEDGRELPIKDGGPSPYDQVAVHQVKAAIGQLGPDCRKIIRLKLLGETNERIAEILGKTIEALYTQSHRCLKQLREILNGKKGGKA